MKASHTAQIPRPEDTVFLISGMFRSTAIIASLSIVTLAMGFIVQVVIAAQLGTSREMDIYLVSIALPILTANVSLNAMSLALVPVFKESLDSARPSLAWNACIKIIGLTVPLSILMVVFLLVFAVQVTHLLAPGFDPPSLTLAARLLRIMSVAMFFDVQRGVMTAFYYAEERFFIPQFVPLLNHVIMMLSALLLLGTIGIEGLALGWALGSMVMFIVLVLGLVRKHNFRLSIRSRDPAVSRMLKSLVPSLALVLMAQATPVIDRLVASTLPAGSISFLGYGIKLLEVLMRTIPMAVVVALFPVMSRRAAKRDWQGLEQEATTGVRWVLLGVIPLGILVALLREPLVKVLFQRGAFGQVATAGVSAVLGWYAIALIPASIVYLLSHVFFAIRRPWALAWIGFLALGVTGTLDFVLSRYWGFRAIAGTYLGVSALTGLALAGLLRRRAVSLNILPDQRWSATMLLGVGAMVISIATVGRLFSFVENTRHYEELLILVSSLVGVASFLGVLWWAGTPEIRLVAKRIRELVAAWVPPGRT